MLSKKGPAEMLYTFTRTDSAVHVKPAKNVGHTHTQNRQGAAHARAHAGAPASVILRANHVDLHHARPLTLALPLPSEDTVDL